VLQDDLTATVWSVAMEQHVDHAGLDEGRKPALSGERVDQLLACMVDAEVDAARIFRVVARSCGSDLLAVTLDRRALDHEARAQALRTLRQGAGRVRRGGSLATALRCRWLQLRLRWVGGMAGESGLARICADAERRLLCAQDRALRAGLPAHVVQAMRRHLRVAQSNPRNMDGVRAQTRMHGA